MKRAISVSALVAGISFFLLSNWLNSQTDLIHMPGQPGPVPPSYFGMHIHHATTTTPWPSVPFASWRLWDAYVAWPNLEPQPGKWNFTLLDKYLQLAQDHHVQVLLPLALSPQWASARPTEHSAYQPGFSAEPKQLGDWYQYVTAVVQHCKGKVPAYEIWNEPNYKILWSGRTDQLVDLTKAAHDIIKSVDPNAHSGLSIGDARSRGRGLARTIFGTRRRKVCRCYWLSLLLKNAGGDGAGDFEGTPNHGEA